MRPAACRKAIRSAPSSSVTWGARGDDGGDVGRVGVEVLPAAGMDVGVGGEGGDHVVLGRERVRGAQRHLRPAAHQRADEIGGLGRHVQAGRDAHAVQRALGGEALAHGAQDGHLPVGPRDPRLAGGGEARVGTRGRGDGA